MRKSFQINGMINNVEDHHLYFITYDIDESIKQQVNSFCISNNIKIIIIIIRKDLLRLLFYFRMLHKRERVSTSHCLLQVTLFDATPFVNQQYILYVL
jgi:hypothetical protein